MLKKEEYFAAVRRPYPPLYSYLVEHGWAQYERYEPFNLGERWAMRHAIKSDELWYFSKADTKRGAHLVFRSWADPTQLQRATTLFAEREKALMAATKQDFAQFVEAYENYMPAIALVFVPEKLVAQHMQRLIGERLPPAAAEEMLGRLNIPLENNVYKQEEYDLAATNDLAAHVAKYSWINSRYGSDVPYTVEEASARKSVIDHAVFLEHWNQEKEQVRTAISRAKELLGDDGPLVDLMQFIVYYRTRRTDIINHAAYLYIPTLRAIAQQHSLTYEELLYCMADEIMDQLPAKKVIQERMSDHAIVMEEGKVRCLIGKASQQIREFLQEDTANVDQLTGAVACKGLIKGTARIVVSAADMNKVQVGDILITSMTTPNMIPAMKRAAAFVTDEGGITCHAAIISREMKKPCIIGTRIATKVFHDGDTVEVNAETGVVRKVAQ